MGKWTLPCVHSVLVVQGNKWLWGRGLRLCHGGVVCAYINVMCDFGGVA